MKRLILIFAMLCSPLMAQDVFFNASWSQSLGTVATPTFNNDTGSYSGSTSVTISDATPGAGIFYCTNVGSDCSPGTGYTVPVSISVTGTHLCSNATKASYTPSATKCATYTITTASLPFSDTFAGSGALGANWAVWYQTAGAPVRNSGYSSNAWGDSAVKLTGYTMPNNQWAEVQVNSLATSQNVRLLTRLTANSNTNFTGYSVYLPPDGSAITLSKCSNSFSCSWMASCGTVTAGHTYRLLATGSTISVNDNGSQACTATDSTYASGTVGLQEACSGTCPAIVNFQAD